MRDRTNAMAELKALLRTRKPLYALADYVVDTSSTTLDETATRIMNAVENAKLKRSRER
jgi:shikimate kinase